MPKKATHTNVRLQAVHRHDGPLILDETGAKGIAHVIQRIIGQEPRPEEAKANAARLVACWNACQDIPTEALNAGLIAGMLGFIQMLAEDEAKNAPSVGDCGEYTTGAYQLLEPHGLLKSDVETDDETRSNGPRR